MVEPTPSPGSIGETCAMPVEPIVMRLGPQLPAWLFRAWELLAPRFPRWAMRWIGRLFLRLPPGSRARRWFLRRVSAIAWDATARTRFDLVLPIGDPACEWHWDATARTLGSDELYHGHEGFKRSLMQFNEIWTDRSFTVRELLDGGDTLVMRMSISGRGVSSGAPAEMKVSAVARLNPFIIHHCNFFDDAAALREAGFAPVGAGGPGPRVAGSRPRARTAAPHEPTLPVPPAMQAHLPCGWA